MSCDESIELIHINEIDSSQYGSTIRVRGTVVSLGPGKSMICEAIFKCNSCGGKQSVIQPMGKFLAPKKCENFACHGERCSFERIDNESSYIPSRIIKISEGVFDVKTQEKKATSLDVHLTNELVEECSLTEIVEVTGKIFEPKNYKGREVCGLYMWAHKLVKNPPNEMTPNNIKGIQAIMKEEDLLALLVHSFCPSISGNHLAKLGLLLALVGGHEEEEEFDGSTIKKLFRGEIHVLLCANSIQKKGKLLSAAHNLALHSSFIDDTSTSIPVFEITSVDNDHTLLAGPVLQANKGICCLQDIDRIKQQKPELIEIMDSEVFQTARDIHTFSMPVNISILAGCFPKFGTYDARKSLLENLNLPSNMLNQFDLIFALVDDQDTEGDINYASTIPKLPKNSRVRKTESSRNSDLNKGRVKRKLSGKNFNDEDEIPPVLLSRYIQYVRKHVTPKFSQEAAALIFDFNHDLNEKLSRNMDAPGIDHSLRSLMRLAIARTRLEGRPHVEEEDALDIIDLVKETRFDCYPKDFMSSIVTKIAKRASSGTFGSGLANPAKKCKSSKERFFRYLQEYSKDNEKYVYTSDELYEIEAESGYKISNFGQMISWLNEAGFLLYKGNQTYQLIVKD